MKAVAFLLLSLSLTCESFLTNAPLRSWQTLSKSELFSTTTDSDAATENKQAENPAQKQAEYGKTLELPKTYARCGACSTSFALTEDELQMGKGRRVECSVCGHSWFQSRDRLMTLNDGLELVPLPEREVTRIKSNIENNRNPKFTGNAKLYVGNLDFGVTEDDIYDLFKTVGEVGEASLVTDPTGRSRGFAFVTMMTQEDGDKCIEELNGAELNGRNINVKLPNN